MNPLQQIEDAKADVARRAAQREQNAPEYRKTFALEKLSDEASMIRAEMSAIRELLAMIQAKLR